MNPRTTDLDELRTLVPPPPEQRLSSERLARHRVAIMREILSSTGVAALQPPPAPSPRRRLRRRVAILVLVPAALFGAAVAYSVTAHRSAEQLGDQVTCFQGPELDAPSAGAPFTGQDLASFCDAQWTSGSLAAPPPGPAPARWVACQSDTQGVDVFPGDDEGLCERLGLHPLPPGYYDAVKRYSAMESDLQARFPGTRCVGSGEAAKAARRVLDAHGYTSWTIRSEGFADLTPCALAPDLDPVNGAATIRGGVRPELLEAVRQGLDQAGYCGPQGLLLRDVQESLARAGFGDWTAEIDHQLTGRWPCVAGFNEVPATRSIVLVGLATR